MVSTCAFCGSFTRVEGANLCPTNSCREHKDHRFQPLPNLYSMETRCLLNSWPGNQGFKETGRAHWGSSASNKGRKVSPVWFYEVVTTATKLPSCISLVFPKRLRKNMPWIPFGNFFFLKKRGNISRVLWFPRAFSSFQMPV